jgi:hypothetical protein
MSTIKPRDLVRTPSGATGTVVQIMPCGEREVMLLNGTYITIKARLLYLVQAAAPKRWPEYSL